MADNRLIVLAVIGLLVIGFVRILEQPDVPEDALGGLFREDSLRVDPVTLAACAALQHPLDELFEVRFEQVRFSGMDEAENGCGLNGVVSMSGNAAPPEELVDALFSVMGWEPSADEAGRFRRAPVTCTRSVGGGSGTSDTISITITCRAEVAVSQR